MLNVYIHVFTTSKVHSIPIPKKLVKIMHDDVHEMMKDVEIQRS